MAKSKRNTNTNQQKKAERRSGALACLRALQEIEKIAEEAPQNDETFNDYVTQTTLPRRALTNAAGAASPCVIGFLDALSDYIMFVNNTGTPNFAKWKPSAAMSEKELAKHTAEFQRMYEQSDAV